MDGDTIDTPWGDVTLGETRFAVDEAVHGTDGVAVPTGAGRAVAAFSLDYAPGSREDDAVPERVLMVLYGGYFTRGQGSGIAPVGETTFLNGESRLRWRAEVRLDPMDGGVQGWVDAPTRFVDDRGYVSWGVGDASPRLRAFIREALIEARDRDPSYVARLYAGMMEAPVIEMEDEVARAKAALDLANARMVRGRKAVDAALDLGQSASAPRR
jgi:hypothetical protein